MDQKILSTLSIGLLAATVASGSLAAQSKPGAWVSLVDGPTLSKWRGFKTATPSTGWKVLDGGVLSREGPGGDLMTADQYGDFELELEWKISPGGNSGIMYHVTEDAAQSYETGPEMQVLDNAGHADGKNPKRSAASNYDMHAPVKDVTKPVGEWNAMRLIVRGAHVEHWLNGVKVVEFEQWSPEWEALFKASKFSKMPGYGRSKKGHIVIQDHGNPVWFRNIRIRNLGT